MKKKILLIQPTIYDDSGIVIKKEILYFVGLAYPLLAAMTPKEWEVEICLETIEEIPYDTDASVIGVGGMGQAANRGKDIAIEFKKRGKIVLMGGPMVTLAPELAKKYCDCIVLGDAENIWLTFLNDIEKGELKPFYKSELENLSTPLPRYDLILNKKIGDFLPVQAGRGCPNKCNFCSIFCIFRGKYIKREIDEVIRDIKYVKSLGFKKFLLLDDNIISDRDYMLNLCKEIKKLKMKWMSQCAITIALDDELLKAVSDSGCYMLGFGLESISKESLKKLNKEWCDPEVYKLYIDKITDAGIDVATEMIVGVDTDTKESLYETIDFIKSTRITAPKFYIMTPIPGTDLFNEMLEKGRIIEKDFFKITASKAVITHPNMSTEDLNKIFWEIYDKIYTYKSIFKRTIFQKNFFKDPGRYFFFLFINLFYKSQIKKRIAPIIM